MIPPLTDSQWPDALADLKSGFAGQLNVYRTMAHHPALLRAWAPLRDHIVNHSSLGAENAEIVILRTGLRLQAPYEWAHHIARARAIGISDARIRAVRDGGPARSDCDQLLCDCVDALVDLHQLPAALSARITAGFGAKAVFDLIATVGFYTTLGLLLNTAGTPIDKNIADALADQPLD